MTLEQQLAKLDDLGLKLDEGVTIDDLLYSCGRESYEERPFDLILFVLGIEVERKPWGRSVCSRVWNFDTECIVSTGDYVKIVQRLCIVAGNPALLKDIRDFIDTEAGKAWIKYTVNGVQRNWTIEVNHDWADTLALSYVMSDIQRDGFRFYTKDNGQAMILFYLDTTTAAELNKLSGDKLVPVFPE